MKRLIVLVIAIIAVLSLVSCSSKAPIEKAQDEAIKISEAFLNYEISADEAYKTLDEIVIPNESEKGALCLDIYIDSVKRALFDRDYERVIEKLELIKDFDYTLFN